MDSKARLIQIIREKSYREGDFTLASGKKSKFYIDLKATTLDPEGATLIGELSTDIIQSEMKSKKLKFSGVGGLTLGADPIATAISVKAFEKGVHLPAFIVRKEPKSHGISKYIEGIENLGKDTSVIVVEDVVTTGGSSIKAIDRLKEAGFKPDLILTVVDREEGGEAELKKQGYDLVSLVKLSDLKSTK